MTVVVSSQYLSKGKLMATHEDMVRQFMQSFMQSTPDSFSPDTYPSQLRSALIMEEALEFAKATDDQNWVEIIDAICDLLYVTYGAAIAMGIDINPFFEEVHRSNMSKLDPVTGRPMYREDGKVLKPSTYSPADLKKVLLRLYGTTFVQEENKSHE